MTVFATAAAILILLSVVVQAAWMFRRGSEERASHWLLAGAAALLAVFVALRSLAIGFPALTGSFESLVFWAFALCACAVAYRLQRRLPFLAAVQFGITVAALALLAIASSPIAPKEALAPIPALRSLWLVAHVALSFIGESFFVAGFAASLCLLLSRDNDRRAEYDRVAYSAIAVGYPVFTAGALVFGAIWAEQAWGSWWSWDPKETWALVTWLVYTLYLHLRLIRGKRGAAPAVVAVLGFLCALFTFFGVNYLLSGLHSYG